MGASAVGSMVVVDDVAPSAWLPRVLQPFGSGVGALVPPTFEDYARVLHPAYASHPEEDRRPVTWREIAESKQRLVHPVVQFPSLVGTTRFENGPPTDDCWSFPPTQGTLPWTLASCLASVLAGHTSTPDRCWFGVWDGFGDSLVRERTPVRVRIPGRDLVLLRGPVSAIDTSLGELGFQSANLWWPEDRGWCVATDIDLVSTYVGGRKAVIAEVVACPGIEALRVRSSDPVHYDADELNPSPQEPQPEPSSSAGRRWFVATPRSPRRKG